MINKRILISLCLVGLVLFTGKIALAENVDIDSIKTQIELYLKDNKFDLLGRNFDKEYFKLVREYAGNNPFKLVYADIKTLGLTWKATEKIVNQNNAIYLMLGGSYGFKFVSSAEKAKLLNMFLKFFLKY